MSWYALHLHVDLLAWIYFLGFDHFYFGALLGVTWLLDVLLVVCWDVNALWLWIVGLETSRLVLLLQVELGHGFTYLETMVHRQLLVVIPMHI